ncbi:MAG: redoxin family protein [Planctomycetes bacterium]|nr:redoxin family protein [Planctomycetota bacterium]
MIRALATLGLLASFAAADESQPLALGSRPARFTFTDTRWLERELSDFGPRAAYVIVFTTLDCPVANRVMPRVAELERAYRARDVQFLGLNVGADDALVEVAARAIAQQVEFPVARDFSGEALRALTPERTPEIVVLDREHVLRYRGRLDASERVAGTAPDSATIREDLREALEDVLAGRAVRVPRTVVDGCRITPPAALEPGPTPPTWADGVGALVGQHCGDCHVAGGSAPFALGTFAEAKKHAAMIAEVVEQRRMPPWFASREHGSFQNARGLADDERRALLRWVAAGAPEGDPARAPAPPPPRATGWRIGEPDLVLAAPREEEIPATGRVPYRYVILPHVFLRETWVAAVEIAPSNPQVVHHANLGFWKIGSDWSDSSFVTGHVPGGDPMVLAPGVALSIPAGSVLGLQIHYVPTGSPEKDRIAVGLRFPRERVEQRLRHHQIRNTRFEIPPGAPAHPVRASRRFDVDAVGIGMFVHMHLRGRDMDFVAGYPDGREETLLLVPNYSFDWQTSYVWHPGAQVFPAGTTVTCRAHFDNSRFNPFNPDPARAVRFGQETEDEMMYGFLFYVARDERLGLAIDPRDGRVRPD